MSKTSLFCIAILLIVVVGFVAFALGPGKTLAPTIFRSKTASTTTTHPGPEATLTDLITVDAPLSNSIVKSPLTISGKARGSWFFEASAPVELKDSVGNVIGHGTITATGDWMTTQYVPFTTKMTYTKAATKTGTLILRNDNPSGDPARQKTLEIPVNFQ